VPRHYCILNTHPEHGNVFTLCLGSRTILSNANMRLVTVILVGVLPFVARAAELKTIDGYRDAAAKHNAVLAIPDWEQTPQAVEAIASEAIAKANRALDQIGAQD
jgi:hypothetical protein